MASIFGSIKEAANPFVRMTWNATNDDGSMNVPYFQLEEIKEAAFQSEYACDTVFRTLMHRLEGYTAYPIVLSKTLGAIRVLMMEGPSTFSSKMGSASGKLLQIVTSLTDVRRGSVEERNRDLAQALHQAISGDTRALVRFATDTTDKQNAHATSAGGKILTAKSDFQAQQEREQKMYRKKVEEEKSKSGVVIASDRQFEVFDASLPPVKLVDSAMQSPKKRFAKEELDAFVSAAVSGERVSDVCAALDAILRDGKASLQNRYKVLTIIEALVVGHSVTDAVIFFRQHSLGLQRHLTIERADNPVKAEAAKAVAHSVMVALQGTAIPIPTTTAAGLAGRVRGASGASASLPKPTPTAQSSPAAQSANVSSLPPAVPTTTTATAPPPSSSPALATQWQWNGPSQPPSNAGTFDDLFSNLSLKPSGSQGLGNGNPSNSAPPAPSRAKQPIEPHHSPAANPWDAWGAGAAQFQAAHTSPPLAQTQLPSSYLVSPPLHPSFSSSITAPPVPNTSLSGANASVAYPVVPNASFASSHESSSAHGAPSPPTPTVSQQQDIIRRQMEDLQRNMMLMMQQVVQRQPAATVPPPPPVEQAAAPQPQQQPPQQQQQQQQQQQPSSAPVSELNRSRRSSVADDAASSHEGSCSSTRRAADSTERLASLERSGAGGVGEAAATVVVPPSPEPISPPPPVVVPTAAAVALPNQALALQMLSQLQAQMDATQRMLAQQQAAFQILQAQLFPNGGAPSQS